MNSIIPSRLSKSTRLEAGLVRLNVRQSLRALSVLSTLIRNELKSLRRKGATLSEVLVSLLIMSIGLVSVATLFPLAVLRSVTATQLTNATILRHNAEAALTTYPAILQQAPYSLNANTASGSTNSIFDPLGYSLMAIDKPNVGDQPYPSGSANTLANRFGNNAGTANASLFRYALGFVNSSAAGPFFPADFLVTSQDTYNSIATAIPTSSTTTSAVLPSTIDLGNITGTSFDTNNVVGFDVNNSNQTLYQPLWPQKRVLVFDPTLATSQMRILSNVSGGTSPTITWQPALPTGSLVGQVQVQAQDRRYTWLLTIRRDSIGICDLDLVIFYKRPLGVGAVADEQIYSYSAGYAFDPSRTNNSVVIDTPVGTRPFLKKGSYIFDAQNALWFRILAYDDTTVANQVTVTLDRTPTLYSNAAIFMRGIVDVFPLGTRKP